MAQEKEVVLEEANNEENEVVETVEQAEAELVVEECETEGQDELSKANERIAELEAKLQEAENRILRNQADFENYKRRVRLDQEAATTYRAQSLVSDLLPALDNFERALQFAPNDEHTKSLVQGMDMVYRSIFEALQKEGVEAIAAVGEQFNPHLHQAVMQAEDADAEPNTVIEEFQKGYKLKDRVLRPSMVKVSL